MSTRKITHIHNCLREIGSRHLNCPDIDCLSVCQFDIQSKNLNTMNPARTMAVAPISSEK
jgi:hypothetical protein